MAKKLKYNSVGVLEEEAVVNRFSHTFAVGDAINLPLGDVDYIPGFFIPVPSGQTVTIKSATYKINGGTSVTFKLQKNGSDITGYTGISCTTTKATTTQDAALSDGDYINPVVTAVSGSPKNLSITIFVDYAV